MNSITLQGTWIIKAPRDKVYAIMSDFENMPKYFPKVAKSLKIIKRDGNHLTIDGTAKTWGKTLTVRMETELKPPYGFISDNKSAIGTQGHEEFMMEEIPEGTRINYLYQVEIKNAFLRAFAKPLIGWYAMRHWEKAVVDVLRKMLEK
ncbi:MAG: SRPBCC family protein [Patescibacteria group bacterium]